MNFFTKGENRLIFSPRYGTILYTNRKGCAVMTDSPAKRHKSTFDNIPQEKRDRILHTATGEFAQNGFEGASMEIIAKKADISVGSLYKYFDSKEDMFVTVAHQGLKKLEKILTELYAADEDIGIKVEKIVRESIEFSRREPDLIRLYCALTGAGSASPMYPIAQEMEALSAKIYCQAIVEAQKIGDVRQDIDPGFFAFMLDNLLMGLQFSYACDYYKKRYAVYGGDDIADRDDFAVEQTLKFIKAAFNYK